MAAASASDAPPNFQISDPPGDGELPELASVMNGSADSASERGRGYHVIDRPSHGIVVVGQFHRRIRVPAATPASARSW